MPLLAGPLIMGSHVFSLNLWFAFAIINTINSHCGYMLPGLPSPLQHDYHHMVFNENFGLLGILDSLYGTNKKFKAVMADLRNKQDTHRRAMTSKTRN